MPTWKEVLDFIKHYTDNEANIRDEQYAKGDEIRRKWQPLTHALDSLRWSVRDKEKGVVKDK